MDGTIKRGRISIFANCKKDCNVTENCWNAKYKQGYLHHCPPPIRKMFRIVVTSLRIQEGFAVTYTVRSYSTKAS